MELMGNKIIRGKLSDIELAYIAGIIDGEGCVGIHKCPDKRGYSRLHYLYLCISNNNPIVIDYFQSKLGGNITKRKSHPEWNPNYKWFIRSGKAEEVLSIVLPFLLIKKEQAKVGIEFSKIKSSTQGKRLSVEEWNLREEYYLKIKELNNLYTKPKPHHQKLQPQRLSEGTIATRLKR